MLRRTKKFTGLLQNEGNAVDFAELAEGLRNAFDDANVYIISRKGKILGYSLMVLASGLCETFLG